MKIWKDISISSKLYIVIGTMAFLIILELLVMRFAMDTLSAVRAFVGGEGLWSQAQKNALFHIQRYGVTKNERDYELFLEYLKVPEGDHIARIELLKPDPNYEIVYNGFIQGQIHPDDIPPILRLLERFYWEPHMAAAIEQWTKGDETLVKFKKAGTTYRNLLNTPKADPEMINNVMLEILNLNNELTVIEKKFSEVLGNGSRWLESAILSLLFIGVIAVESVGLTLTFLTSRNLSKGLSSINQAAVKMGQGDFGAQVKVDSQDEIGKLAESINAMGSLLSKSYQDLESRVNERTAELSEMVTKNQMLYSRASEALKTRDEFISVASHELKTPLTALQMQLQYLAWQIKELPIEDEQILNKLQVTSEKTIVQAKRLSRLTEELMDLTRIKAGKLEITKEVQDLTTMVSEITSQFAAEASRVGSVITIETDGPVVGSFDPVRISQAYTNLLSNALKYGEGKPIEVSVAKSDKSNEATITIKDHGSGIPKEKQDKIFKRYERVGSDDTIPGLGLGLYITKQIVLAHGGRITVQSDEVNKGTTFNVVLPLV